ncbi:MAG: hypothetical protein JOZ84_08470 [Methylobacteriaceae bacterium]|nr:hypothetical protein [Methylobacteriaceae bacterium]
MSEIEHLAQADRHIADAERRITEQERRVVDLEAAGHDTTEGKRLLRLFRETLVELEIHREAVIAALQRPSTSGA